MPRYKLVIEYEGGPFCGWQRQAEDPTVQGAIEAAVMRFSGEEVRLTCAGRTDAGVHAIHQVAHLDLAKDWRTDTVRDALNAHLRPQPVAILSAEIVPESFDARHSAIRRHYRYRILNRRSPAALTRAHVWHVPWPLDADRMHAAAQRLVGRHYDLVVECHRRARSCTIRCGPWSAR
jgi:tRNA pseudouridine38-40 synthase